MKVRSCVALPLLALSASFEPARSQAVSSIAAVSAGQGSAQSNPLERKIDVELRTVSLSRAIDDISSRTGIRATYVQDVVASKPMVSLTAKGITGSEAFARILRGTGLELRSVNGQWAVIERKAQVKGMAQGVIAGKVSDAKSGKAISGATISAETRSVVSSEDGSFRLVGLGAGTHTVTVRLVGYARQTKSVAVGEGATATVDFKLEPSASVLDQVIVTGTVVQSELRSVPNAISVVTAKDIEERGITRIDQLFRGDIPGLFSVELGAINSLFGQVRMFSRGATNLETFGSPAGATNPIKTYVDGVELADPKYLSQIDPKSIERIEILTGPQASTIYGSNAINGVMQIFTKRGNSAKPKFNLAFQSGMTQNSFSSAFAPRHNASADVNGVEGRLSYAAGGSWDYTGSWTPGRLVNAFNTFGSTRAQFGPLKGTLSARNTTTRNRQGGNDQALYVVVQETGLIPFQPSVLSRAKINTTDLRSKTAGVTVEYAPANWWSNEVVLGSDESSVETTTGDPRYGTPSDTTRDYTQTGTVRSSQRFVSSIRANVLPSAVLNLTLGGDHGRGRSTSVSATNVGSPLTGTLPNPVITRGRPDKNRGAFAQGQLALWDELFFTYGMRAEWNPNLGSDARVLPGRYGVAYTRDLGFVTTKLRGSYGRSTRPPSFGVKNGQPLIPFDSPVYGVYYTVLPNADLASEFQQGGEGGVELYFANRGSLVVTRYNQTVDGLISQVSRADSVLSIVPSPADCAAFGASRCDANGHFWLYEAQFINVGSIRNQGWELQSSVNTGPLTTRGTYSWTKSRMIGITEKYRSQFSNIGYSRGHSFNFLPEHTWSLNFSYAKAASSVALYVNGVGQNFISENDLTTQIMLPYREDWRRPRYNRPSFFRPVAAGYTMADMSASHRFAKDVEAILNIRNLTDYYRNDNNPAFPTAGRETRLGVRWRL